MSGSVAARLPAMLCLTSRAGCVIIPLN